MNMVVLREKSVTEFLCFGERIEVVWEVIRLSQNEKLLLRAGFQDGSVCLRWRVINKQCRGLIVGPTNITASIR